MAASALAIGKKAPDFALPNQDDEVVKLRAWRALGGPLLLPKRRHPGCTVEACDFTSGLKDFEKLTPRCWAAAPTPPRATASSSPSRS
jgi:peroxiredoxin